MSDPGLSVACASVHAMSRFIVWCREGVTNGVLHASQDAAWADAQRILSEHGVDTDGMVEIDVGGYFVAGICRSATGALAVICMDRDRTEMTAADFSDRGAARAYLIRVAREVVGNDLRAQFKEAAREVAKR